jgi:ferrochelatase
LLRAAPDPRLELQWQLSQANMPRFETSPEQEHPAPNKVGVLVVNLGTPDEPTPAAVRRYLKQFLSDPRVVEAPRWLWWPVLEGFVLRVRPSRSAAAYRRIWTGQGSPLLVYTTALANAMQQRLAARHAAAFAVEPAMSYGNPSIESALRRVFAQGADRIVVLPLYPQYSGSTTGSVFTEVTRLLSRRRVVPELRFINQYHDSPDYIGALAASVAEAREANGPGERLLFSFHGLPRRMVEQGDPYYRQCLRTAELVAERLGLQEGDWQLSFQSRVGRGEWLRPYTDEVLQQLGENGMRKIDVLCPGFAVDCLETLEEIAMQNAERFAAAGGGELSYIPALNTRDGHISFLSRLVADNAAGWAQPAAKPSAGSQEQSTASHSRDSSGMR